MPWAVYRQHTDGVGGVGHDNYDDGDGDDDDDDGDEGDDDDDDGGDYDDGDGDDDDYGLLLNDEECDAIGCGEYFSLVAASDVAPRPWTTCNKTHSAFL